MKKMMMVMVGMLAAMGMAGTIVVPTGVTTNLEVAVDTTLTDAVTVSDRSAIEKTGAGTLTLPGGQFTQNKAVQINVREGAVAFTPSPQALAAYPQPTETMNKAAFWLESRTNLVKDGDDIVAWRDVRDVDPATTNHYYAIVDHTWTNLCPQEATYTNKAVVYFRGYASGCWMNWQNPAGGQATVNNLYHVFIVHGAQSTWGYVLGQRKGQDPYFQPNGAGGADAAIWIAHNFENKPMHASRTFRDGIEVDPFTTGQGTGIHVIEVDCLEMRQSAQCFYNDRDFWKDANGYNPMFGPTSTTQTAGGKRAGGEYICEMLLFTNRLSEVERVSVSNWLLAKWRDAVPPQKPAAVAVTLATNTVFEVNGGALASLSVSGDGTLVKTGADTLVMPSLTQPAPRTVHVCVDEGPVTLGQPLPVVGVPGDTVTSTVTYAGPQVTKAPSAGTGRFVKAGNGPLLLDEVPEGVTNLVVSGGLLTLADPDRKANAVPGPDRNVAAAIPEWDFESYNATSLNDAYKYIRNEEYKGWHGIVPSDSFSEVFVFDNTFGAKQHWNLALATPNGKNCLVVKHNASAWCAFTVPETGNYALEFWAAPRGARRNASGRDDRHEPGGFGVRWRIRYGFGPDRMAAFFVRRRSASGRHHLPAVVQVEGRRGRLLHAVRRDQVEDSRDRGGTLDHPERRLREAHSGFREWFYARQHEPRGGIHGRTVRERRHDNGEQRTDRLVRLHDVLRLRSQQLYLLQPSVVDWWNDAVLHDGRWIEARDDLHAPRRAMVCTGGHEHLVRHNLFVRQVLRRGRGGFHRGRRDGARPNFHGRTPACAAQMAECFHSGRPDARHSHPDGCSDESGLWPRHPRQPRPSRGTCVRR